MPPEEDQQVIVEKEPLTKAVVQSISPDITVPFNSGQEIFIIRGKQVVLGGQLFIHVEHILLYQ